MLSISDPITLGSDAEQYYLDKAKEAYYTDGKVGQWFGGAERVSRRPSDARSARIS
jgi:hypothetical protein